MNRTLLPINSVSVRNALDRGDLKAVRIGDRVMVDSEDLAAFSEGHPVTENEGAR